MLDREFLIWIHARLTDVHGEDPTKDYMHKLRAIIKATDPDKTTPNVMICDNLDDLDKLLEPVKGVVIGHCTTDDNGKPTSLTYVSEGLPKPVPMKPMDVVKDQL